MMQLASYPGKAQSSGETTLDKHITVQQVLGWGVREDVSRTRTVSAAHRS